MGAIGYLRVSTTKQGESGLGLEAQEAKLREYCETNGLELSQVFTDVLSGGLGMEKRPGLLSAVGALGRGDVFLVAKRDRLGRDPLVVGMVEASVKRRGAVIVSTAGEGTEGNDPSSVLMRRMIDAFAEYERLIIGARTKAAMKAKRDRGEWTGGGVPYGYNLTPDGRLQENHKEQMVLFEIENLRSMGLGYRKIADALNKAGYTTKTGLPWRPTRVSKVVQRLERAD